MLFEPPQSTGEHLRVLFVEDRQDDVDLTLRELKRVGFSVEHARVETAEEMRRALAEHPWDIVLSDYSMPAYSGPAAIATLKESGSDIALVILSGTIDEETAVGALHAGATDFVVKGRLARLGPAIRRALRETEQRRSHRAAREAAEAAARETATANAASEAKTRFLAHMSHELRTPLNAIIGFSEVLELEGAGPLTEQQREFVGHVHESGKHLLALINDVLDISKVEAGRMELHRRAIVVASLVLDLRSELRPVANKRDVRIEASVDPNLPPLHADPTRVRQILHNLVSNAIKFARPTTAVTISATRMGESICFEVRDEGIGIAAADLPRLFVEFQQIASPGSAPAQGTGLGLALTKRLVELHGGEVAVESELGRGSIFRVFLPFGTPAAVRTPPPPRPSERVMRSAASILIVDDDPRSRRLVTAMLASRRCEVDEADTCERAKTIATARRYDLVLTDIGLPDGSGADVLDVVRKMHPETMVVAMTAHAMSGDRERFLERGFDAYLPKPLESGELGSMLDRIAPRGVT
jgi:signal transduction histidine kinase